MSWPSYSSAEVVFLMSLTRREVIDLSADTGSSLGRLSVDGKPTGSAGNEEAPISLFARWTEVQSTARRVVERDEVATAAGDGGQVLEILELRAKGMTLREIGERVSISHSAAYRGATDLLQAIVGELGGEPTLAACSQVPACMSCGHLPRTRLPEVRRRALGGQMLVVTPERLSSLCVDCKARADDEAAARKRRRRRR